jgi:3-oxoacyl-[acyl-carrier-protein] synthase II
VARTHPREAMVRRDVVVTGVGAVTPLGVGARELHEGWCAGRSGIRDGQAACSEFDPGGYLSIRELRRTDRFTQLAIVATDEALRQAGWPGDPPYDPGRVGCVLGTGIGGLATIERAKETLMRSGPGRVSPLSIPLMMSNAAPAAVAMRHNLRGPAYSVTSACAAGAHAIGAAFRAIQCGDADAIVTGGSEAALTALARAGFEAVGALSSTGVSRPFDARRDGFVLGEGAGALVLEEAESAARRGAHALARLCGFGASSDAGDIVAPDMSGRTQADAIVRALADAAVGPEQVVYVNAHGTSTPVGDRAETMALKQAFGTHAQRVAVSSTKSAIGHLLGAAGPVETVATILALRDRIAPPTLGWEEPEEGLDLDYVPLAARPLDIDGAPAIGISSSFGFGGQNAVLCVEAL